jgi:hypothetical protein
MPEMPRYTWGAKGFGRNPLRAAGTEEFEPMRVLIVEDEALVALQLEELLLDEGFEVVGSAADATHRPTCMERSASSRSPASAGLWLKPYGSCRPICVVRRRRGLRRPCFVLHPRHSNDVISKQGRPLHNISMP